jgi:nucleoside-diphosphate-sugar epimerase
MRLKAIPPGGFACQGGSLLLNRWAEEADCVFHLAAMAIAGEAFRNPCYHMEVSVERCCSCRRNR